MLQQPAQSPLNWASYSQQTQTKLKPSYNDMHIAMHDVPQDLSTHG